MSDQQGIMSTMQDFLRNNRGGEELMNSLEFAELVARLERSQQEQRAILSLPPIGELPSIGATDQQLLMKQSCSMIDLLTQLTSAPSSGAAGAASSSSGGGSSGGGSSSDAHPLAPPQSAAQTASPSSPGALPAPPQNAGAGSPSLIDFAQNY